MGEEKYIRAYEFVDSQVWESNISRIKKILLGKNALVSSDSFSVAPNSGWIFYSHEQKMWTDLPKRNLLKSEKQVIEAVKKYVVQVTKQWKSDKQLAKAKIPPIFPSTLQHWITVPVFHYETGAQDHWLSRFRIFMRSSTKADPTPLLGSSIDFRVGNKGEIIGMNIQWRPIFRSLRSERLQLPASDHAHDDHDDHEEDTKPTIVYVVNDELNQQRYLAPFYYVSGRGHHPNLFPASRHSMKLVFGQRQNQSGASVSVFVAGGSGKFTFQWGGYRLNDLDSGVEALGPGTVRSEIVENTTVIFSEITVGPGVHNLIAIVEDIQTGAVTQEEYVVYAKGQALGLIV